MSQSLSEQWRTAFWGIVRQHEHAGALKEASLQEHLGEWTQALTSVAVATCAAVGWRASAKGHPLDLLPIPHSEYLGLDVIAFADGRTRWRFPVAAVELENSRSDDRIAYSLWKVICVRAALRVVFCYRRSPEQGAALTRFLSSEVVTSLGTAQRAQLDGETIVVIGSRGEAATFPYDFFKWWRLEHNTGAFRLL